MTLLLQKQQRLVMIGDSITDAGRARPVGTFESGLGDGYVSLVNALLTSTYPHLSLDVINVGIGGNTVRHLNARWQEDVIDQKPDWLTIMIGTNDVWRQFDGVAPDDSVFEKEFVETYSKLIQTTLPLVKGVVLLTPFLIETNTADPFRQKMEEYVAIVKQLADRYELPVVDTQAAYDQALKSVPYNTLAGDRIHPTLPGHAILARGVLNALGYEW